MILISGSEKDPNLQALADILTKRDKKHLKLFTDENTRNALQWDLQKDQLLINHSEIKPTGMYLRFNHIESQSPKNQDTHHRVHAWFHTLLDWGTAHESIRMFNRKYSTRHTDKVYNLFHARRFGLHLVDTMMTNDLGLLRSLDGNQWIVKHQTGQHFTCALSTFLSNPQAAELEVVWPMIVQKRLAYPEIRIFRIGDKTISYRLHSNQLDYREFQNVDIEPVETPKELSGPLLKLMDFIGLEYGAADFKYDYEKKAFAFLEVNSAPMFAGFDARSGTTLVGDAIADWLTAKS